MRFDLGISVLKWAAPSFCLVVVPLGLTCTRVLAITQPPATTQSISTQPESNSNGGSSDQTVLLNFEQKISDDADKHREYLEGLSDRMEHVTEILLGLAAAIFGAILTWIGIQNKKDVKDLFQSKIRPEVEAELNALEESMTRSRQAAIEKIQADADQELAKVREEFKSRLRREGIEAAVAQSYVVLGLYEAITHANPPVSWAASLTDLMDATMGRLDMLSKYNPGDRSLVVQRARFDDEYKGETLDAATRIKQALQARQKERDHGNLDAAKNEDDATLLYNLACYLNLYARSPECADPREAAKYVTEAQKAINGACKITPDFKIRARTDLPDLAGLIIPL